MLRTLLESQAVPARRLGGTAISIAAHTAAIALAIVATARATSAPNIIKPDVVDIVYPQRPGHREPPHTPAPMRPSTGGIVVPPVRPVLLAPLSVPTHLPAIDSTRPVTDEGVFDGKNTSLADGGRWSDRLASATNDVYPERLVEKAAAPRPGNPAPTYPVALRAAQLEGSVIARFVVDTTGRPEPESITFTEATHPEFAESVRRALLRSRYLPAMIGGRAVRQLVEQRFAFTLMR